MHIAKKLYKRMAWPSCHDLTSGITKEFMLEKTLEIQLVVNCLSKLYNVLYLREFLLVRTKSSS